MSDTKKIQELENQVKILMQAVDKTRLDRLMPKEEIGTTVRVSIYRENPADEGRLVVGWSGMVHDTVKYTNKGEYEDQQVVVWFDGHEKIKSLENILATCSKPETIAIKEKEIEEAKKKYTLQMSLTDFGTFLTREPVTLKGMDSVGEQKAVIDWEDKEYRIPIQFIN